MTTDPADTGRPSRRSILRAVSAVFYSAVCVVGLWILGSVPLHLLRAGDPLRGRRISPRADNPEEIFRCYFDTLLLFNVIVDDYGQLIAASRCGRGAAKRSWKNVYSWDTHPWNVVYARNHVTRKRMGVWRYLRHEIWSRCRLNEGRVLKRSRVLRLLAAVHDDLDSLRRRLTAQMIQYTRDSAPLVNRINARLEKARSVLKQPRRLKREQKMIKYRLRKWGIRTNPSPMCPI